MGTLSYHYNGRKEIIRDATVFARKRFFWRFRTALEQSSTEDDLSVVLAEVVEHITCNCYAEMVVDYDFFLTGLDDPDTREISIAWSQDTRSMLREHMPAIQADTINLVLEGVFLHSVKIGRKYPVRDIKLSFATILDQTTQAN